MKVFFTKVKGVPLLLVIQATELDNPTCVHNRLHTSFLLLRFLVWKKKEKNKIPIVSRLHYQDLNYIMHTGSFHDFCYFINLSWILFMF